MLTTHLFLPEVTTHPHNHSHGPERAHPHADITDESASVMRIQRLAMFLEAHFGEVELHMPDEMPEKVEDEQGEDHAQPALLVRLDEADAMVNLLSLVSCSL